jgi:hypothetical protein
VAGLKLRGGFAVDGLTQLNRVFKHAPADVRKEYRRELRTVAEPVRSDAERLAVSKIRRVRSSPKWARMRTGVTLKEVYVAPRQRGVKGRGRDRMRRPRFGNLLGERATQPALRRNEHRIVDDFEAMLDRLCRKWDREGPKAHGL